MLGAAGSSRGSLRESVVAFLAQAAREHGATPAAVVEELRRIGGERPRVPVVECSRTLARSIGNQLASRWWITPTPRLLAESWPAGEPAVSTYFHRHDLSDRPSHRTEPVSYLHLRLSRHFLGDVGSRLRRRPLGRVAICETDGAFAAHLAAELRAALGRGVKIRVHTPPDIAEFVGFAERNALKLVSPRNWDRLPDDRRGAPDVMLLEYVVDPEDVEELGRRLGWRHAAEAVPT